MNEWQMKGAYTSQTATVAKLLNEGFEPFWGYRCHRNDKDDVRMYFRKAPGLPVESELLEVEPPVVQVDMSNVVEFIQQLNMVIGNLPKRIAEQLIETLELQVVQPQPQQEIELDRKSMSEILSRVNEVEAEVAESYEHEEERDGQTLSAEEPPAGDGFRVVDEVPEVPVKHRTPQQDQVIEVIRNSVDLNITVYPVDEKGDVNVFVGGKIITIHPNGESEEAENPAGRDSTAV